MKFAIESGDVKLTERLPNQAIDTGHSCSITAEARDVTLKAEMVNDQTKLDSLANDYVDLPYPLNIQKTSIFSGKFSKI